MKRLTTAPNLVLATLWADLLRTAGFEIVVQRAYASGIAGEIPPDQSLPELWVADDDQWDRARAALVEVCQPVAERWICPACGELVEGPFWQCWNCGADMPWPAENNDQK